MAHKKGIMLEQTLQLGWPWKSRPSSWGQMDKESARIKDFMSFQLSNIFKITLESVKHTTNITSLEYYY